MVTEKLPELAQNCTLRAARALNGEWIRAGPKSIESGQLCVWVGCSRGGFGHQTGVLGCGANDHRFWMPGLPFISLDRIQTYPAAIRKILIPFILASAPSYPRLHCHDAAIRVNRHQAGGS